MDESRLAVLRGDPEATRWLKESLKHKVTEARGRERIARAFAGSPTGVLAHQALGDAHKKAAEAYGAALVALDAKREG